MTRFLFASWRLYLDQSNGASISTRALLLALAKRGANLRRAGAGRSTSTEISPWIQALERLWDDPIFYSAAQKKGRDRAEIWREEKSAALYEEILNGLFVESEIR